ncbi:N-acetylmuramic acid 6-phosphate etherase [Martelella sp. HB161492]|uniref:N-acetylmuramic acid 6-phosphate etherase n=1 Tax=Martelella sp. HB161492 TaxID=2720726 RepID=UPI0015913A11|nr:N-acetylmuramic acid 6-phosphate etherase [Martelella sp. HB161492]
MKSTTETASKRYLTIDDWPAGELVSGIVESQYAAIGAVQRAQQMIAAAAEAIAARLEDGGRMIYLGAGTSGRLATLDAAELPPTYNFPRERAFALMAGGSDAFIIAREGAEDDRAAAVADLDAAGLTQKDVVIGIAASGNTPYVAAALAHGRSTGAVTVALYNNPDGTVATHADFPILLETGAEFVAGSTRMKAGTAQKVALTTLSTAVMIRLGYVYRGRMVEMKPTNAKLYQRAREMVAELAGTDIATATTALEACDYSIKIATVMLKKSLSSAAAAALIAEARGNLRRALEG